MFGAEPIIASVKKRQKNPAAVALGRLGATATNLKLSKEQKTERGKKAASARWQGMTEEERKKATLPARKARKKKARERRRNKKT